MENDTIGIENGSEDHKYFTLVPNYILNHSSAIDQALYLQMKRYGGERGICFASKATLMKNLGIGKKALNTSLEYLVSHKWVELVGEKTVITKGGPQKVGVYRIVNIWNLNNQFYEGGAESAPPTKGGPEVPKVGLKGSKGGAESAPNKINTKEDIEEDKAAIAAVRIETFFHPGRSRENGDDGVPMTLQEFVLMARGSAYRHIRVIAEYADERKMKFTTRGQWREFGNRNMRAAKQLVPYNDRQIEKAMKRMEQDFKERGGFISKWSLETLIKYLDEI